MINPNINKIINAIKIDQVKYDHIKVSVKYSENIDKLLQENNIQLAHFLIYLIEYCQNKNLKLPLKNISADSTQYIKKRPLIRKNSLKTLEKMYPECERLGYAHVLSRLVYTFEHTANIDK